MRPNQPSFLSSSLFIANKAPKATSFLAREILANLRRFPHCILLTRVGNFYESYFDQAVEVSDILNIKLTSRKWDNKRVAMCGFPITHLDRYLKVMVQQEQRSVAMCEEFQRYGSDGIREFDRRVSRIVTPGTLIDESFINPFDNNYLLAISSPDASTENVGLAWIDVSTGEFFSKQCSHESLLDELARISPREIVLDKTLQHAKCDPIFSIIRKTGYLVSYCDTGLPNTENTTRQSLAQIPIDKDSSNPPDALLLRLQSDLLKDLRISPPGEVSSVNLLTKFLQSNLREHMPLLGAPQHEGVKERMQIDAHTIQALEIRQTGFEGGSAKGSLLSVIKRTTTTGGTRLLSRWLCSPSTSASEIKARQSLVAFFHQRPHFRADIREILGEIQDVGRLGQRFLLGRADVSDLVDIKSTIKIWDSLKQRSELERTMELAEKQGLSDPSEWRNLGTLFERMTDLNTLAKKIAETITEDNQTEEEIGQQEEITVDVDEPSTGATTSDKLKNRYLLSPTSSQKLIQLHAVLRDLTLLKDKMESDLRVKYGAASLTLRSASSQGMFIHLSRAKRDRKTIDEDPNFSSIGESLTTKSYFYRDWALLGSKINEATLAIAAAEKEVFDMLRLEVISHSSELRRNAHVIDQLDVALSFAVLAEEMNFARPEVTEDLSYKVVNGRHPSVEMGLISSGRQFTPNSVYMNTSSSLHIITGPNMAGKSTFLRQTALIAILAQVGSFVPADAARIGIVDKVFSRIGARDDLYRDRSTFMIEMLETADILRGATERSLIIMDEVGRGTTVKDGLAIAFSALHHLAAVSKSRCLFATHFHELAEMMGITENLQGSGLFNNVRFYCSDVEEVEDGYFAYSYRLQPGINRDSHGLKVARLAGVLPSAMDVATKAHSWLEQHGTDRIKENYQDFVQRTCNTQL
ncbi:MutS2 protein [Crepidotus variabilis]|uniref:MutS2 protein n=1 Tax=Crepidotus variabilis TaxID=179855 RepID=A0A9P6JX88_9AGAR|nr:MutS2 protein [Crepidotus variabilis]